MKGKPNINEFLSGSENTTNTQIVGQIVIIKSGELKPNVHQDRGEEHWETPAAKEYLDSLAASMKMKLKNGNTYGIREPIKIKPVGEDGLYEIIDGESRWRASKIAGLEEVPCIIRNDDKMENRVEHVTSNALRAQLNLWQQANSIKRDQEEYDLSTEQVMVAHGLRSKTQISKLMAVFKLTPEAQEFVKKGFVQDANLVYELKKLSEEQLSKLAKRVINKGEAFPAALKAVMPKESKEGKEGKGSQPTIRPLSLKLMPEAAKALATVLGIDVLENTTDAALIEQLQAYITSLAEPVKGEGE